MTCYVIEQFCDLFTVRPSNLNTTLAYVVMDNFCPCSFWLLTHRSQPVVMDNFCKYSKSFK